MRVHARSTETAAGADRRAGGRSGRAHLAHRRCNAPQRLVRSHAERCRNRLLRRFARDANLGFRRGGLCGRVVQGVRRASLRGAVCDDRPVHVGGEVLHGLNARRQHRGPAHAACNPTHTFYDRRSFRSAPLHRLLSSHAAACAHPRTHQYTDARPNHPARIPADELSLLLPPRALRPCLRSPLTQAERAAHLAPSSTAAAALVPPTAAAPHTPHAAARPSAPRPPCSGRACRSPRRAPRAPRAPTRAARAPARRRAPRASAGALPRAARPPADRR